MKIKLIAAAVFLLVGLGSGFYYGGIFATKAQQISAVIAVASAIAFLALLSKDSSVIKAGCVWLGATAVGLFFVLQPPPPQRAEPDTVYVPTHRTSPAGQINIGTPLYQSNGELAGSVAAVSNRDPQTGADTKMVLIRTAGGRAEWKTRETVIRYYQVKP